MDEIRERKARRVPPRSSRVAENRSLFEQLESRSLLSTVHWDGGPSGSGTDWNDPQNWVGDVLPANGDDAVIDVGSGVDYTGGTVSLNSLFSSTPLTVQAGHLGVATTATVSAPIILDGGGLVGGTWTVSGLSATPNSANSLSGVTINGDVSMDTDAAMVSVTNGLTVNGLVSMQGIGSVISFAGGAQQFGGNADVLFAGYTGARSISSDDGGVLTLGSSVQFSGELGRITGGLFGSSGSVVNTGTIWANTDSGTIEVSPSIFSNTGTLRATGNGILKVHAGNWTNNGTISINGGTVGLGGTMDVTAGIGTFNRTGGTVTIDGTIMDTGGVLTLNAATGSWQLNGGQIVGGTVNLTGGATLTVFPFASSRIAQATINGNLSWLTSNYTVELDGVTLNGAIHLDGFSTVLIKDGITLNGSATITGDQTLVEFDGGAQSIAGNASILLRNGECFFTCNTTLTIPANVSVSGYGRITGSVVNQGQLSSDTAGKILIITGSFQNSGAISVAAGASLYIGDTVSGTTMFTNTGTVQCSGFLAVGPSSLSGPVTVSNAGAMTLGSAAVMIVGTQFVFEQITVNNSGTIEASGNSSITLGTPQQFTAVVFNNTGTTKATGAGQIMIKTPATSAQLGDLRAAGGTIKIQSAVNNTGATLPQNATTGAWTLSGGAIQGGTLDLGSGISPIIDTQTSNTFDGVAIQGGLLLSRPGARLRIVNGLTLSGTLTISGSGAALVFDGGTQLVTGKGHITFSGGKGSQSLSADEGAAVTFDTGITVNGLSGAGQLVSGLVFGGPGSFINNGLVEGNLTINAAGGFTNSGSVEASVGATLALQGLITNYNAGTLSGGTWRALSNSTITLAAGPITTNHATIVLDSPTSTFAALSSLATNSGTLTLSGGRGFASAADLSNSGTIDLQPGSNVSVGGAFTQTGSGTLHLSISAAAYPTVTATAALNLAGTLSVSWTGNYFPGGGTALTCLSGASRSGVFTTFTPQSLGANRHQFLTYDATSVTLNVWAVSRDN